MKTDIALVVLLMCAASPALAQGSSAAVTGAIDAPKNRTSATEAKEDTRAGNRQAVNPTNAGTEAASKHAETAADQLPPKPSATKHRHHHHTTTPTDRTPAPR